MVGKANVQEGTGCICNSKLICGTMILDKLEIGELCNSKKRKPAIKYGIERKVIVAL